VLGSLPPVACLRSSSLTRWQRHRGRRRLACHSTLVPPFTRRLRDVDLGRAQPRRWARRACEGRAPQRRGVSEANGAREERSRLGRCEACGRGAVRSTRRLRLQDRAHRPNPLRPPHPRTTPNTDPTPAAHLTHASPRTPTQPPPPISPTRHPEHRPNPRRPSHPRTTPNTDPTPAAHLTHAPLRTPTQPPPSTSPTRHPEHRPTGGGDGYIHKRV
jgi:hypothetical protein